MTAELEAVAVDDPVPGVVLTVAFVPRETSLLQVKLDGTELP